MKVQVIADGWIGTKEAARVTGYTRAHVRYLAGRGKIEAYKVGRDWLVGVLSLLSYQAHAKAGGRPKGGGQCPDDE